MRLGLEDGGVQGGESSACVLKQVQSSNPGTYENKEKENKKRQTQGLRDKDSKETKTTQKDKYIPETMIIMNYRSLVIETILAQFRTFGIRETFLHCIQAKGRKPVGDSQP